MIGDILWAPPADWRERSEIGRFMDWLRDERGLAFRDYEELRRWSVTDLEAFWGAVAGFFEIRFHSPYERVLGDRSMPGAKWFAGATLNYAEHLVGRPQDSDTIAVLARSQTRGPMQLTFGELAEQAARARSGLQRLGVGRGDRVVAYLPNIPETLVMFIATVSLGAIWASCAPEFGARSVIDRFAQIEPKILVVVPGYTYRDRHIDRTEEIAEIRAALPTVEHVIGVPYGAGALPADVIPWGQLCGDADAATGSGAGGAVAVLEFEPVAFDHPLYVLFSSGTTGLPKAIIHSHGGQLVEHLKHQGLVWDLKPGSRLLWFSTTAWMMWNALVSCLLVRSSIVMLDGDPIWPDLSEQWRLAQELRPTNMGISPVYLMACRKAGLLPGREFDLSSIETLHTAGSPLPAEGYRWVYEHMAPTTLLSNGSGGTDLCTGVVEGCFARPVYEGEIAGTVIGADVKAFGPVGDEIVGEVGEMVITSPMPSMPVGFWGDTDGSRVRDAYFDVYPGVWRQGDWIKFTERGTWILSGRSDATLNRGGVRLGTGEFYAVIEELPEITDSLVVHLEDSLGGPGQLLLFVVWAGGSEVEQPLIERIAAALRSQLSPRHVPDQIVGVHAIPRTLTGKKLEAPVKRILLGESADQVASRGSLLDPSALDDFVGIARGASRERA
jgi:acetoacetyl-CoA synthetase